MISSSLAASEPRVYVLPLRVVPRNKNVIRRENLVEEKVK